VFTTSASGEFFVVKLRPDGQVAWAQRSILSGINRYAQGRGIVVSTNGSVFVGGHFRPEALFGTNSLLSAGRDDAFIAHYAPEGELRWVRNGGGTDVDTVLAVTVNGSGGCYISGGFVGAARLFGSNVTSRAFGDVFTASFDTHGTLVWIRQVSAAEACGIATDRLGDAYVLLRYPSNLGFEKLNSGGAVLKYRADGRELWPRSLGVNCCNGYSLTGIAALDRDAVLIGSSGGGQLGFTNLQANIVAARIEAPTPRLRIASLTNEIRIYWPGWAYDFLLESKPISCSAHAWLAQTNFSEDSESARSARSNTTNSGVLFRLRK
jgi:hypothetical protein